MSSEFVVIHDNYGYPWRVEEDNPLYQQAKTALQNAPKTVADGAEPPKVYWPLAKLVEGRGWGWWTVFHSMEEVEQELEKIMPHPAKVALIEEREYTPTELQDILQMLGGHLALLHSLVGKNIGSVHALKEGYNAAIKVGLVDVETSETTVTGKEGQLLFGNELLRETKRRQIQSEAVLAMLKGWIDAYDIAWQTVSRVITLRMGEASLSTGRHL